MYFPALSEMLQLLHNTINFVFVNVEDAGKIIFRYFCSFFLFPLKISLWENLEWKASLVESSPEILKKR